MKTVIESAKFTMQADKIWLDDDLHKFVDYIAANPNAGDVIPGTGGVRKVRWSAQGSGNRGGTRVVYINSSFDAIILLAIYKKSQKANIGLSEIKGY